MLDAGAEKDICVYERSMYGKDLLAQGTMCKRQIPPNFLRLLSFLVHIPCVLLHLCLIAVLAHNLLVKCNVWSSSFRCQVIHVQHESFYLETAWWELTLLIVLYVSLNRKRDTYKVDFPTFWGFVSQLCWQFWHPSLLSFLSAVGQAQIYIVENTTGQHHVGRLWSTCWCPS